MSFCTFSSFPLFPFPLFFPMFLGIVGTGGVDFWLDSKIEGVLATMAVTAIFFHESAVFKRIEKMGDVFATITAAKTPEYSTKARFLVSDQCPRPAS